MKRAVWISEENPLKGTVYRLDRKASVYRSGNQWYWNANSAGFDAPFGERKAANHGMGNARSLSEAMDRCQEIVGS